MTREQKDREQDMKNFYSLAKKYGFYSLCLCDGDCGKDCSCK
jgi:hypothetical protein